MRCKSNKELVDVAIILEGVQEHVEFSLKESFDLHVVSKDKSPNRLMAMQNEFEIIKYLFQDFKDKDVSLRDMNLMVPLLMH